MDPGDSVRYRSHAAITFTVGLLRALSIVAMLGSLILGAVVFNTTRNAVFGFGGFVVGLVQATVLWALADGMQLLADGDNAHIRLEWMVSRALARTGVEKSGIWGGPAARVTPAIDREAHVKRPNGTPGYRARSTRTMARLVVNANLLAEPAEWAPAVLAVRAGDSIVVLGEVGSFVFAETGAGDGWLAKSALAP